MEELIPITDFDKRYFPEISEEEKINFIMHSNDFERISMKYEQIQANLLIPQKAPPAVQGQMRCLNWITDLASNPDLIPKPASITPSSFDALFPWFPKLHKNLLHDFARKGEELLNQIDYPSTQELGIYRTDEKALAQRQMPPPYAIKKCLSDSFKNYATIYNLYKDSLSNPRLIETSDWKLLEKEAHNLALHISCIKPFSDGSNRIARITENLLRLNVGLKFKIFTDKNAFLKEVLSLQDSYYKIYYNDSV